MYADAGAFGFAAYSPAPAFSHAHQTPPDFFHHLHILGNNMVQPSLVSEYDLGGEGDLFKAPEPIIEEPLLSLDPMEAAISIMSGTENAMDEAIEVGAIQNDPLLSEVLYECEEELMEKSAIEETISELLDVKIPMLQVEELPRQDEQVFQLPAAPGMEKENSCVPECSVLQKSVSSECLNSEADWINGAARPNFLDFQGLDFEAAFGLRRAFSEGDIQTLGASIPRPGGGIQPSCERLVTISDLKTEERKQKLSRYRKKKVKRNFGRKIKYACRKALADSQPRVRGRFAKVDECDLPNPRK